MRKRKNGSEEVSCSRSKPQSRTPCSPTAQSARTTLKKGGQNGRMQVKYARPRRRPIAGRPDQRQVRPQTADPHHARPVRRGDRRLPVRLGHLFVRPVPTVPGNRRSRRDRTVEIGRGRSVRRQGTAPLFLDADGRQRAEPDPRAGIRRIPAELYRLARHFRDAARNRHPAFRRQPAD